MPEADQSDEKKNFHLDVPVKNEGFFLKGSNSYDWGMKNRLSRVFQPQSGKTVMLAFDHGYFQGPTTGLERCRCHNPAIGGIFRCINANPRNLTYNDSCSDK